MTREIIAILRGIKPDEVAEITDALISEGISKIEVPLNSPDPFTSIERMLKHAGDRATIGAGTVLDEEAVKQLAGIGAKMVVSPDCNSDVIQATKASNMLSYPGVFTASESFTALRNGADGLKFFPASLLGIEGFKALKSVLPANTKTYAVGGVGPSNFQEWEAAGITGFGMGSSLYKPGITAREIALNARETVKAYDHFFN
ncbi:2-dehydro-3-deoxy-6-phosphogalactonate aldolase [Kiloniella majae]|uniref:2-dehydro-3-deoxy-6-phosphogalactonate aldolase n=1 Tax=Kiloniella majae TaxID=1938558 RepID=UPI000A278A1D|nr:2-dehydro-3-deoxy-6-phosphogalactonate aldolase [Kiloniella majae]